MLIYGVGADKAGAPMQRPRLPRTRKLATERHADLFGRIVVTADASRVDDADWDNSLYRPAPPALLPTHLIAVPYHWWNNRGTGTIIVWVLEISRCVVELTG